MRPLRNNYRQGFSTLVLFIMLQLQQATSEMDFHHLLESSQFLQLMESSGCRRIPVVSKTILGYCVYLPAFLLCVVCQQECHITRFHFPWYPSTWEEQISRGLSDVGLLKLIRLFPMEFEPLFVAVSDETVSATAVLHLLKFPDWMNNRQQVTASMLRRFIHSCSSEGKY